jgi:hypothetical protein
MEYNSEEIKSFKTPPANMKSKYLKVDLFRLSVLRKFILEDNQENYFLALNKSISEIRVIINR